MKCAIQGESSTNCISATGLNSVHSGTHSARPSTAPTSAVQRAGSGLRSLPMASTSTPKAIGTQITSERRYPWNIVIVVGVRGPYSLRRKTQKKLRSAKTPKIIVKA